MNISEKIKLYSIFFISILNIFLLTYFYYSLPNGKQLFKFKNKTIVAEIKKTPPWWQLLNGNFNCHDYLNDNNKTITPSIQQIINEIDEKANKEIFFEIPNVYRNDNESCSHFLHRRHFIQTSQSQEEANFSIAYSILVYRDYSQVEMLLQTIYRPEHAICIHIDAKSTEIFKKAIKNLADCFDENSLFISPESVKVNWGGFTALEPEIICMRHLLKRRKIKKWKYFINLTGQEFPLKTNLELVKILSIYNGANNIEGTQTKVIKQRFPTEKLNFSLTWTKGQAHIVASAAFVNFTINSPKAQEILRVLQNLNRFSDEVYFATLNHNPQLGTPGAYTREPESDAIKYPYLTRLKNWWSYSKEIPCKSRKVVRALCIWGLEDLPTLTSHRHELFVNKFHWNFQHVALQCLQQWYWNRTQRDKETGNVDINLTFYQNLSFVKYHQ